MKYCVLVTVVVILSSCWWLKSNLQEYDYDKKVMGWRPIYGADSIYKKLTVNNESRPVEKAGKIYVVGNYIFQNDIGKGIHVIDNTDPVHARRVAFWALPGNTELALKGSFLYANNYDDMVVIDITDHSAPRIVKRMADVFATYNVNSPYPWQSPEQNGYYECPKQFQDSVIVNWVADSVHQYCYKP